MQATRLGIATADGVTVASHLARSTGFVVLEIVDGVIQSSTLRERASGPCGNHARFADLLAGCQAVLCGGIGRGAADGLIASGIEAVVVEGALSIEEAAERWLAGTLKTTGIRVCLRMPD